MTSIPNVQIYSSANEFVSQSAAFIARALKNGGSVALSGGKTPLPVYAALGLRHDLPWDRISLFQVDERYAPRDHAESNYRGIRESIGRPIRGFDPSLSIPQALAAYECVIASALPFDLCVLGIGPGGHTASLFPHSTVLHETKRLVAHTTTDAFAIRNRLTITFPAIMASKHILVLLQGKEKQKTLDALLREGKTIEEFPAKKLLEHPSLAIYFSPVHRSKISI